MSSGEQGETGAFSFSPLEPANVEHQVHLHAAADAAAGRSGGISASADPAMVVDRALARIRVNAVVKSRRLPRVSSRARG